MKVSIKIAQAIVAILFIVSGLVKANDPLGLSYKMEEFFLVWNESLSAGNFFAKGALISLFNFLNAHSLALSVIMITLEIAAGVALITGWRKTFVLYLLLILIVFFTFLTGYAYTAHYPNGSPKFTNCGCFGDCLPITPFTSFLKDIVLLLLIVFLIAGKKYISKLFSPLVRSVVISASVAAVLFFQWYVLNYLPVVDCLPFKVANNIAVQMKPPPGSVPDSIAMRFIYEKGGKSFEFAPENLPADLGTYTFKDRIDKLVRKGNAEPAIKGFVLVGAGGADSTEAVLNAERCFLLFIHKPEGNGWIKEATDLFKYSKDEGIPFYVASSNTAYSRELFRRNGMADVPVFSCDFTVVRTAARTDPTLYSLQRGTITGKYGRKELSKAKTYIGSRRIP